MISDQTTLFSAFYSDVGPILKWAGGKRYLIHHIKKLMPEHYNQYIEPFVGGASVLLSLRPKNAIINDINFELMSVYRVIKNDVDKLIEALKIHAQNDSDEYYYRIRSLDRQPDYNYMSMVDKAARTIYLNKTCFNGLYRVNSKGYFNVPRGKMPVSNIINDGLLKAVSSYFNEFDVVMMDGDFVDCLSHAIEDDFIYFDPPYDAVKDASFVTYNQDGFDQKDQIRLRDLYKDLSLKGCKLMLSNAATEFILDIYSGFNVCFVDVPRFISASTQGRAKVKEVIITNF